MRVSLPADRGTLDGDFTLPASARAVVLLPHGVDSSRQNSRSQPIATQLNTAGSGTLLMDLLSEREDRRDTWMGERRFDAGLLARRLVAAVDWIKIQAPTLRPIRIQVLFIADGQDPGFVLHVVEPHLNGPAGEVPIILAPAGGEVRVLCGQGVAPAGATIEHYRGLGLELVPGTGPLAAAVPGAFDAWMLLLRNYGTKSLADVLKYAIGYAEHGHAPVERVGETVETVRRLFEEEWVSSAEVYLPGGKVPRAGELFRNPALAATWKRLLAEVSGAGDRVAEIDAPNWHNDSFPGSFYPRGMHPGSVTVESRMPSEVVAELRRRGHDVTVGDAWSEGRLCAVARDPETGVLSATANPRGMRGDAVGR